MLLGGNAYFRWKDFVPPEMPDARKGLLAPGDGPNFPHLYDHSMKAPLAFAGPGIPHGRSDALVHLFDIYPPSTT
jgi:hypothetical protein